MPDKIIPNGEQLPTTFLRTLQSQYIIPSLFPTGLRYLLVCSYIFSNETGFSKRFLSRFFWLAANFKIPSFLK